MNLKINNLEWHIRLESPEFIKEQAEINENQRKDIYYFGLTDYKSLTVYINSQIPRDLAVSTVLHELTHVYIFSLGFEQFTEENMCSFIASHADTLIKLRDTVADELLKENSTELLKENSTELFIKEIKHMLEYVKELNSEDSSDS